MWNIKNNDQGQKPEKRKDLEMKTFQSLFKVKPIIAKVEPDLSSTFTWIGGLEGDRTLEPHGCEPCALPAELQAHILFSNQA